MRRGNIFGSREPVNKVDSYGGFFTENVERERKREAWKRYRLYNTTLDKEKEKRQTRFPEEERIRARRYILGSEVVKRTCMCCESICVDLCILGSSSRPARRDLQLDFWSTEPSRPAGMQAESRRCFSSNAVSSRGKRERERERKGRLDASH